MAVILLLLALVVVVILFQWMGLKWESPAGVNILFNFIMIVGGIFAFRNVEPWNYFGVLWMIASCLLFAIGQKIGAGAALSGRERYLINRQSGYEMVSIERSGIGTCYYVICLLGILLGFLRPILMIWSYGFRVIDMLHIENLLNINTIAANARYNENVVGSTSILQAILTVVVYFLAIYGGYLFSFGRGWIKKLICLCALLPILCSSLIDNTKSGLLFSCVMWGIGWVIAQKTLHPGQSILNVKSIIIIVCLAVLVIAVLFFIMMLRIGSLSMATASTVSDKIVVYAFGHIYAFDYWFGNQGDFSYGFGSNTFMTITNWFGISNRVQGVYSEWANGITNVYTRFRGEIMDFGIAGGLIFEFVLGGVAGVTWRRVCSFTSDIPVLSTVLLAAIYFMVLEGMFVSPWVYTSYTLAFILFGVMLFIMKWIRITGNQKKA